MIRTVIATIICAGLLGAMSVSAMTIQLADQPDGSSTFIYRFQKPNWDQDVDEGLLAGYHEFQVHLPLSGKKSAVVSLPLARVDFDNVSSSSNGWNFGNVYLGYNQGGLGSRGNLALNIGAFLPTAEQGGMNALLIGLFSDPHHIHRFVPDLLTVHVDLAADLTIPDGLYVRTEIGTEFMVPTGDSDADAELMMRYGIGFGARQELVEIGFEFVGQWLVTSGGDGFGDSSSHILSFGAEFIGTTVSPGIFLSNPTDDDFEFVDWIWGIRVKVRTG